MRVAVLGTGTMGIGIAHSLLRAGLEVTAWNRHPEKAAPLADAGARVASSAAEAVANADVVVTMVFDESAVTDIASEFLAAMPKEAVWMQAATVGPAGVHRLAELAARHGVTLLDTPVVGTKQPAEKGTLVVLVSGDAGKIGTVAPVTEAIGSKTVNAGAEIGAASALKLACNAWVATLTAGTAQSLALCLALGVDPHLFLTAIAGGASDSPYLALKGGMMLAGDYAPSFGIDGLVKDLNLAIEAAEGRNASSALLRPLHDVFSAASDAGHAKEDVAAVVTTFGPVR